MKFRPFASSSHLALKSALALASAGLLVSCLQDPGQTGLGYLNTQGYKLTAPLYHLSLEDIPVDSTFTSELPLDHFGDSLIQVGRHGDFTAKARMGFQITTLAQHRLIDTGFYLRFVPLDLTGIRAGKSFLVNSTLPDTLSLLVESFSWVNTAGSYNDSLSYYHSRILRSRLSFNTLPSAGRAFDTVRVPLKDMFRDSTLQDSSVAALLPQLRQRLQTVGDSTNRWIVYLQISPLTAADTGMLRFTASSLRSHASGLWFGRYLEDSLPKVGTLLGPYRASSSIGTVPAVTYEVAHNGASTRSLLYGVSRGVHFRLNRDTLINRIRLGLNASMPGDSMGNHLLGIAPTGKFDRRFYVPYAELRLPLRDSLTRVDGPFALDMQLYSDIDSLSDGDALGSLPVTLGTTLGFPVKGGATAATAITDTLRVSYRVQPDDTTGRQIILSWAKDPGTTDTFTVVPDGRNRELTSSRHIGWLRSTTLGVTPSPSEVSVGVYFSASAVVEPSDIIDPATGRKPTTTAGLQRRFLRPGADSLTVRATRGVGALLNRVSAASIAPDLYLRGVERSQYDTSLVDDLTYRRVTYPVTGEVEFPRDGNGKVRVGLDVYLYPLEGGK